MCRSRKYLYPPHGGKRKLGGGGGEMGNSRGGGGGGFWGFFSGSFKYDWQVIALRQWLTVNY